MLGAVATAGPGGATEATVLGSVSNPVGFSSEALAPSLPETFSSTPLDPVTAITAFAPPAACASGAPAASVSWDIWHFDGDDDEYVQVRDRGVLRSVLMKPALSRENHSSASLSSRLDRSSWSRPPAGVASAVKSWYLGAQNSYLGSTLPPLGGVHSIPSSDIGKTLCFSTTDPVLSGRPPPSADRAVGPNGLDPGPIPFPNGKSSRKIVVEILPPKNRKDEVRGAGGREGTPRSSWSAWVGRGRATRALGTWTVRPPEIWLVR